MQGASRILNVEGLLQAPCTMPVPWSFRRVPLGLYPCLGLGDPFKGS